MYENMQEFGLTEIIPLMWTLEIWGLYPVFLHPVFPQGSPSVVAATVDNWHCLFTNTAGSIPILSINQKLQSLIIQNE